MRGRRHQPRHADLLAADVDEATLIRLIDRFLMFYIHTARPAGAHGQLDRRLEGGVESSAGSSSTTRWASHAELEAEMAHLVARTLRVGGGGAQPCRAPRRFS